MADTLLFRGGSTADINLAETTINDREIVIDTNTDQIVSGSSKRRTVMEGDASTGLTYTASGGVARTVKDRLQDVISVKDFGAVGDGVTDDTLAIRDAVREAKDLVLNRHYGGVSVYFPRGAYLITAPITIQETNIPSGGGQNGITLVGDGATSSAIIANNPNFDYVRLLGTASRSYYGGGIKGLGFIAKGNATAGAMVKLVRTIGSTIEDVQFDGGFENLLIDGCADLLISDYYGVDVSRTGGTCSSFIKLTATEFVCSDVHMVNVQIKPTGFVPNYSIIINGCDGIYCSNGHQFGGLRFEPQGVGVSQATTATFWSNWYFDTAPAYNVLFIGNVTDPKDYNNHRFVSCDMRDADRAFGVDSNTSIENIIISNSRITGSQKDGIFIPGPDTAGIVVSGCVFNRNNLEQTTSASDLFWNTQGGVITGCLFKYGDQAGTALKIGSQAQDIVVGDCDFSVARGTKISDSGIRTVFSNVSGVTITNSGTATLVAGDQAVTVAHGCDLTPSLDTVVVTPITDAPGVTRWYADNSTTPGSFRIRTNAAPTADVTFAWQISYKCPRT